MCCLILIKNRFGITQIVNQNLSNLIYNCYKTHNVDNVESQVDIPQQQPVPNMYMAWCKCGYKSQFGQTSPNLVAIFN